MEKIITTSKFSDTEIKITTVTPEEIIPEKVEEVIVNISEMEAELKGLESRLAQANAAKVFDSKQYEDAMVSHDARIADIQKLVDAQALAIKDANDKGVFSKVDLTPVDVTPEEIIG